MTSPEARRIGGSETVDEVTEAEGLVITDCPNCTTRIALHPAVGGDDWHPEHGGSNIGYKKGSRTCPECGKCVTPILSVTAK